MYLKCFSVCVYVHIFACNCDSVSDCQHLFQSFAQSHIPKVVILSPLRYTVKKTHRHTSELRHTTNIHPEI